MKKAIIFNDTSSELHHGCETVVANIKQLLSQNNIKVIATNPVGIDWANNIKILTQLPECDVVLVNGEGTIHHSQSIAKKLVSAVEYIKNKYRIPVVLLNATCQDNDDSIVNHLRQFDLVYVRETRSKNELSAYDIPSQVVPDMTFYSAFHSLGNRPRFNVGVTDSVYESLSRELLNYCLKKKYIFLPALKHPNIKNKASWMSYFKHRSFKVFSAHLRRLGLLSDYRIQKMLYYNDNYQTYIEEISNLEFLIAARYHSLCFALKTLTPFVAIKSNSHKIEGMLEDVGIGEGRIIEAETLKDIRPLYFSDKEREKIESYVKHAPFEIENMFLKIREFLDNKYEYHK